MLLFISTFLLIFFLLGINLRARQRRKQRREQVQDLHAWMISYQTPIPAFQLWKQGLSMRESEILFDLVQGYCTSLNWKLDWLLSPQIQKAPELQAVLETSINNYLETIFLSLQKELDVNAYLLYLDFEKKPTAGRHQALIEPLYDKLERDRLIPQPKRIFSRITRRKANASQQIAGIQHAFEHDPKRAMLRLKEVLSSDRSIEAEPNYPDMAPVLAATPETNPTAAESPVLTSPAMAGTTT